MTPPISPSSSRDNDDSFEMVVDCYLDCDATGATPGPASPAIRKMLEADRENIQRLVARSRREQEKRDASRQAQPKKDDNPRIGIEADSDDLRAPG